MPSPFPGMDPYLENPDLWRELHNRLIVAIAIAISPPLRPKYRVAIEKRAYLSDGEDSVDVVIPDVSMVSQKSIAAQRSSTISTMTIAAVSESVTVTLPSPEEIRESYLEIREVETGCVVTAIELLSPTNKRGGEGRRVYKNKRRKVLATLTHLVEIDLLRSGQPMPIQGEITQTDYRILVSRRERRPQAQLYAFSVRQKIPEFLLPLQSEDNEPIIDLQHLLNQVYDQAGFDLAIDYSQKPIPSLKSKDRNWAEELLRDRGLQ